MAARSNHDQCARNSEQAEMRCTLAIMIAWAFATMRHQNHGMPLILRADAAQQR
jgi:hypothetical protein